MIKKVVRFGARFIDYRMALIGGFFMGCLIFTINYKLSHYVLGSFTAGLKQAAYSFFMGGLIMKTCENIAVHFKNKFKSIILSALIPSIFTISLTLGMHNLRGTPKPFESSIPTFFILPTTLVWGIIKRRKFDKYVIEDELV